MGVISALEITLIVPTLQRGNASQDAPRPLSSATRCVDLISALEIPLIVTMLQRGNAAQGAPRPLSNATQRVDKISGYESGLQGIAQQGREFVQQGLDGTQGAAVGAGQEPEVGAAAFQWRAQFLDA